ncbi:MAG: hypothetical protein JWN17_1920 [Frankiales bacterium]|nr:hypothetical protein [Frankiales bacterium]
MTALPRTLSRSLGTLVAVGATLALSACGTSDVTAPRLQKALAPTFANLYVQRAGILGETGITTATVAPKATCDRGGPKVADVGPGADWICMISFTDDAGVRQDGKFEVQAKANSTYTAAGPSKLIGLVMITDVRTGKDVPNPVFEFDGAFDPQS